jgi:hypothetical protein
MATNKKLQAALDRHAEAVKKGCKCPPPTYSKEHRMVFAPQSESCPIHGG